MAVNQYDRINAVINRQDKLPFDVIFGLIIDPTWPMSDALKTKDNSALGVLCHGLSAGIPAGPLACMLVSLNSDGELIVASGTSKAFGIFGCDLKFDYFQTPGIRLITTSGPNAPDGFPVHYAGGRAMIDRYMIKNEGGADLTYLPLDLLYRSTTGMITKDSATDTTVIGQVLTIYADGRLDCKFFI